MPKICCVFGLSVIWNRGSSLVSVESMTSNRPSSGVLLSSGPKLTLITVSSFSPSSAAPAETEEISEDHGGEKANKTTAMAVRKMTPKCDRTRRSWLWFMVSFAQCQSGRSVDQVDRTLCPYLRASSRGNM